MSGPPHQGLTQTNSFATLKKMEKVLLLSEYGQQLWTRERASQIRERLDEMLHSLQVGDTLVIDAEGVKVFDYSFANELFGKTLLRLPTEHPGRFIVIENLTEYTRENLAKALESLNLIIIERQGAKLQLLGKVHPTDEDTFAMIAQAKRPITAATLKDQLGINVTAMNERLTKLTRLAVIRREKIASQAGREQYQYAVLK